MPSARQGDIHDYDFGPVIGAELSGQAAGPDYQHRRVQRELSARR